MEWGREKYDLTEPYNIRHNIRRTRLRFLRRREAEKDGAAPSCESCRRNLVVLNRGQLPTAMGIVRCRDGDRAQPVSPGGGARYVRNALAALSEAWSPKNCNLASACSTTRPSRNSPRNRRESTRTGRKKPGRQAIQCVPSIEMPPPDTMQ
jgi:hypothetical protein